MDDQARVVRVMCLPGCGQAWLERITDAAFGASGVSVRWVIDSGAAGKSTGVTPTVVLLRYPFEQFVAWFDELCGANPRLDDPRHWIAQATSMASSWQHFARRWLVDPNSECECLDVSAVHQDPMLLVAAISRIAGCPVPNGAELACASAIEQRPDPKHPSEFRYYGPAFARVLEGFFATSSVVDLDRRCLRLARSSPSSALGPGMPSRGMREPRSRGGLSEALSRFHDSPVIIHTCLKVGSKSILAMLGYVYNDGTMKVHDVHFISEPARFDSLVAMADADQDLLGSLRSRFVPSAEVVRESSLGQAQAVDEIRSRVIGPDAPARVITAVRDPIQQAISMFFQVLFLGIHPGQPVRPEDAQRIARDLVPMFESWIKPEWMQEWFDREYAEVVGAPVSDLRVAPDQYGGIGIFGNRAVLLLRCGDYATMQTPLLEKFFGRSGLCLPKVHHASGKVYAPIYSAFKSIWRPSESIIEAAFAQPVIRQCYAPSEIDAMIARWRCSTRCAA